MRILVFVFFLALSPMFLLANKPIVVSSASIFADMAKEIGGEMIEVEMIVPIGGDPHLHEPTPRDAKLVKKADIILLNGLTFEGWINELVENSGTNAKTYVITEGVKPIESEVYKGATDPHAWMDASKGIVYAENIKNALVELEPEQKAFFEKNYDEYKSKLSQLHQYILDQIQSIPKRQRILVTSHDAFAYYGKAYGLRLESVMGVSTEADVRTADIMRVSKAIKENNIPAIFVESTINPKLLQQIAGDTKAEIGGELFADSLGDEDSPASTYYDMLKSNTDVIVGALKSQKMSSTKIDEEPKSGVLLYLALGAIMLLVFLFFIFKMRK